MLLFVGLGNPTPDSENNRHNVGFKIIDSINKKFGLSKQKPKFKGLLTTGNVGTQKVYAIKPLTFMNNSGICIRELIEYFKIDAENVIVFHDDLDVDFSKIKTKFGGSSAGHNGIESIDKFIGKDYSRVRVGIGKPEKKIEVSDFVLNNFTEEEKIELEKVIKNIIESTVGLSENGSNSVAIYPNPSTGNFNLNMSGLTASSIDVNITDVSGKVIMNTSFNTVNGGLNAPINISNVEEGVYIVRVNGDQSIVKRIVVSKK